MRSLKVLLVPVVVAAAVVGLSVSASAGRDARPFGGTVSGVVNFLPDLEVPDPGCPIDLVTVSDGQGTFTHLGKTTMRAHHCTPPFVDFAEFGEMILTAANGDEVWIEYNLFAPFPGPGTTVIHGTGDFEIVGGTGRFADATGGQPLDADWGTYNYTFDIVFPGFGETGPLPGPWSATWTFGPTIIGY